uniref:Thioredoxin domain-containing protein n=1 Tax=Haptolina ericina TaxID=156174 RepID=A0A7S3BN94_9EUKA
MSIFTLCLLVASAEAFSFASSPLQSRTAVIQQTRHRSVAAVVVDITSTDEFNNALETAGDSLVVIDYSTSWCGPCKIIAPKYDELSEQYKNVAFLKVMGDSSPDADKLMRSQGVRALPSFHFWKNKKQVDSVSGAKTQALQDAIEQHM